MIAPEPTRMAELPEVVWIFFSDDNLVYKSVFNIWAQKLEPFFTHMVAMYKMFTASREILCEWKNLMWPLGKWDCKTPPVHTSDFTSVFTAWSIGGWTPKWLWRTCHCWKSAWMSIQMWFVIILCKMKGCNFTAVCLRRMLQRCIYIDFGKPVFIDLGSSTQVILEKVWIALSWLLEGKE